jgi:hypothetical protein
VQEPRLRDIEALATLLQHVDCVVTARTILLDALVNLGCRSARVLYDEETTGRPASRGRRKA